MAARLGHPAADELLAELGFAPVASLELKVEALRTAHGKLAALIARLEESNRSIQGYLDKEPTDKDLATAISDNAEIMAARTNTKELVEAVLAALGEDAKPRPSTPAGAAAAAFAAAAPVASVVSSTAPAAHAGSPRSPDDEAEDLGVFL